MTTESQTAPADPSLADILRAIDDDAEVIARFASDKVAAVKLVVLLLRIGDPR